MKPQIRKLIKNTSLSNIDVRKLHVSTSTAKKKSNAKTTKVEPSILKIKFGDYFKPEGLSGSYELVDYKPESHLCGLLINNTVLYFKSKNLTFVSSSEDVVNNLAKDDYVVPKYMYDQFSHEIYSGDGSSNIKPLFYINNTWNNRTIIAGMFGTMYTKPFQIKEICEPQNNIFHINNEKVCLKMQHVVIYEKINTYKISSYLLKVCKSFYDIPILRDDFVFDYYVYNNVKYYNTILYKNKQVIEVLDQDHMIVADNFSRVIVNFNEVDPCDFKKTRVVYLEDLRDDNYIKEPYRYAERIPFILKSMINTYQLPIKSNN